MDQYYMAFVQETYGSEGRKYLGIGKSGHLGCANMGKQREHSSSRQHISFPSRRRICSLSQHVVSYALLCPGCP